MMISLIGRPNVGKSTLFNLLIAKKEKNLSMNRPGVTRDFHYGWMLNLDGVATGSILLVDTGGFYPEDQKTSGKTREDIFFHLMKSQAEKIIADSDLILLMLDVREGVLPADRQIIQYLRKKKKTFWIVGNKYDTQKQEGSVGDLYTLGIKSPEIFLVSAAHSRGLVELKDKLFKYQKEDEKKERIFPGIKNQNLVVGNVAIIGTPNVGKSTLMNKLLKQERSLVSELSGTTVDPVESLMPVEWKNKSFELHLVDTAGIRKKSNIEDKLEEEATFRALSSINKADVVILLVDAVKGMGHQEKRLYEIAMEKGKSVILCLNKADLVKNPEKKASELMKDLVWHFGDIIFLSAKTGKNIDALHLAIEKTFRARTQEINTHQLNDCLAEMVERRPIMLGSRNFKVKYASLVNHDPPTILIFTNRIKNIPSSYRRYLQKGIQKTFSFINTPVHLVFRKEESKSKVEVKSEISPAHVVSKH